MTETIQPLNLYSELSTYLKKGIDERPTISACAPEYDAVLYEPNEHPFPLYIAGVVVETIDIETAKFVLMNELSHRNDQNRVFIEFRAMRDQQTVHIVDNRMRSSGGRLVLTCGGEILPRIIPRCDLNVDGKENHSRSLELSEAQCTRFYKIFTTLEPTVFLRPKT